MPGETGPVASASLGSAIENGGRERLGQLGHPASKCRTATERLSVRRTGRHQSRDGLASVRNRDFVPLSNLSNQRRQVLPGFTYSCFFHPANVLHVALACNCPTGKIPAERDGRDRIALRSACRTGEKTLQGRELVDQPRPDCANEGSALANYLPSSDTRFCNLLNLERETRLELATPTLARSCSTN